MSHQRRPLPKAALGQRLRWPQVLGMSVLLSTLGWPVYATPMAQTQPNLEVTAATVPDPSPLDLAALQTAATELPIPGLCPVPPEVVTFSTVCQIQLTIPSLWWAKEQFGGRLLENWLAYAQVEGGPNRIDLIVNPQAWSLLNYTERYAFIHHFGTSAREYRYNTRIFNRQGNLLAAYTCDFTQLPTAVAEALPQRLTRGSASEVPCQVLLNSSRRDGLRRQPSSL